MQTIWIVSLLFFLAIWAISGGKNQLKKNHIGWGALLITISVFLILGGIGGIASLTSHDNTQSQTSKSHHKESDESDNEESSDDNEDTDDEDDADSEDTGLKPGDKIDTDLVKNHDFYYSDEGEDPEIRYFTNHDKVITAIKVLYRPDHQTTADVKSELSDILEDDDLKYGDEKASNPTLDADGEYNIYSPDDEKWYHVRLDGDEDGKVIEFSMWPGKKGTVTE